MYVELNVLGSFVVHWIGRHVYRRNIVAECKSGFVDAAMKFAEKLPKPNAFSGGVREGTVFRLSA